MIDVSLSSRDRKTLLVGVTTIASLWLAARGVPAWYRWQQSVHETTAAVVEEARASRAAIRQSRSVSQERAAAERAYLALAPAFVDGRTPSAAGATLASAVSDVAQESGVRIGALQTYGDSTITDGFARVALRGDATGDIRGVTSFIAMLEAGVPLFSVRDLSISQGDPAVAAGRPETLRVEFVVEALARYDGR